MTWDAFDSDSYDLIANVGAAVYSALLEPPANARYDVPRTVLSVDIGSSPLITVPITNAGSAAWPSTGPGAVRLMWEMRDSKDAVVAVAPTPLALPALGAGRRANVDLILTMPRTPGEYKVTRVSSTRTGTRSEDRAATASFRYRATSSLRSSVITVPTVLHTGGPLWWSRKQRAPTAGTATHTLSLVWVCSTRKQTPRCRGTVRSALLSRTQGTFFALYGLRARHLRWSTCATTKSPGPRLHQKRDDRRTRTWPDDDGGRTPGDRARTRPEPTRMRFHRRSPASCRVSSTVCLHPRTDRPVTHSLKARRRQGRTTVPPPERASAPSRRAGEQREQRAGEPAASEGEPGSAARRLAER